MICADTSVLFSLYANDAHTQRLLTWLAAHQTAITVTPLNEFELHNALRFAEWRGAIAAGASATFWADFEKDCDAGRLRRQTCNLANVLDSSMRLSATHTLVSGHRSFDILHVAAAVVLNTEQFLTFDQNQRLLAESEGLAVPF